MDTLRQHKRPEGLEIVTDDDGGEWIRHPSFGTFAIQNMRSTNGLRLFGSKVQSHREVVALTVRRASVDRRGNRDVVQDASPVFKIYMSKEQFTEAITTPNMTTVPCTIRYERGADVGGVAAPPELPTEYERLREGIVRDVGRVVTDIERLRSLPENTPVSEVIDEVVSRLGTLPEIADAVTAAVEAVESDAKQQIAAYAASIVNEHRSKIIADTDPADLVKVGDVIHTPPPKRKRKSPPPKKRKKERKPPPR